MKIETDWDHCKFIPETEEDKAIIKSLYESLSKEDKEREVFGARVITIDNDTGSLFIVTYF